MDGVQASGVMTIVKKGIEKTELFILQKTKSDSEKNPSSKINIQNQTKLVSPKIQETSLKISRTIDLDHDQIFKLKFIFSLFLILEMPRCVVRNCKCQDGKLGFTIILK